MVRKPREQRVCDEVPKSWAPGAPFLTWAPIGAPFGNSGPIGVTLEQLE